MRSGSAVCPAIAIQNKSPSHSNPARRGYDSVGPCRFTKRAELGSNRQISEDYYRCIGLTAFSRPDPNCWLIAGSDPIRTRRSSVGN